MAVTPDKKNRIARRDFVEIAALWKPWRFPEGLDPAAAGDPFAAIRFSCAFLHFGEKIFEPVGIFEIQVHFPLTDAKDVAMRICETRSHGFAGKIDDARFRSEERRVGYGGRL